MKILISTPLYPPDIGGPATYSKKLMDELPIHKITPSLAYFGEVRHLPKIVRHIVYFFIVIKKGISVDAIYAQDPVSVGFPTALAALVLRKPLLLKIVGDYAWEQSVQRYGVEDLLDEFLEKKYNFRVEALRKIERFVARRAKRIIVPSQYLKTVVERWSIDSQKINVVYNDVSVTDKLFSKHEAREQMNLEDKDIIFVSAGRLVPWKGFDMLISCMKNIVARHLDAKLFIIGDGPQYEHLRDTIYGLGLESNIYLIGKLSHQALLMYISAGDMFLLNTGYEGFSHQILEALAIGVPVITTSEGGNKEILKNNANSIIVPYNDQNAWENSIYKLLSDTDLRDQLIIGARASVEQYTKNTMLKNTAELLQLK